MARYSWRRRCRNTEEADEFRIVMDWLDGAMVGRASCRRKTWKEELFMPLPAFTLQLVDKKLSAYCERKIPPQVRDKVRLSYKIRGNSVTLYEKRPSFLDPAIWTETAIAQFRFDQDSGKWMLYCSDRNSKWHESPDFAPDADLDALLKEVDADPTCIFWG